MDRPSLYKRMLKLLGQGYSRVDCATKLLPKPRLGLVMESIGYMNWNQVKNLMVILIPCVDSRHVSFSCKVLSHFGVCSVGFPFRVFALSVLHVLYTSLLFFLILPWVVLRLWPVPYHNYCLGRAQYKQLCSGDVLYILSFDHIYVLDVPYLNCSYVVFLLYQHPSVKVSFGLWLPFF